MAVNNGVHYNPVPHEGEHIELTSSPHSPLSPSPIVERSLNSTPQLPNLDDLPPGAAVPLPRFMGYGDGPRPYSYASSAGSSPSPYAGSAYDASSINALNPASDDVTSIVNPGDPLRHYGSPLMQEVYRDDPRAPPSETVPLQEKRSIYAPPAQKTRKRFVWFAAIGAAVILLILIIVIYFAVVKKHSHSQSQDASSNAPHGDGKPESPSNAIISGSDGSQITTEDGSTFTYSNKFGGFWVSDPKNPFNNGAKAQDWSPALNETFKWGEDKIRGVNLGGWLVTEPFIVPALYEKYYNTAHPIDEWTLVQAMRQANALDELENHYKTFVTEEDFAQIAGAGLNFVRIPLGYWAIEIRDNESFVPNLSWKYFLKAIQWARKYGLRINLDLHCAPGSQNGWNHSGRLGDINFMFGIAGIFNAQRTLEYVRVITEFISQPQYRDIVVMFGILNEPRSAPYIGRDVLSQWYMEAYNIIRNITGIGEGKGPFISIHDGFEALSSWSNVFPNADRLALDTHPYMAFDDGQQTAPPSSRLRDPCNRWGNSVNTSLEAFGLTTAGEFSLGINDCGLWLSGVDLGNRYDGTYAGFQGLAVGSCDTWNDWTTWDADIKNGFKRLAMTSMDALQNYFFWTWKIGNSSITGKPESPMWSYKLGLDNGWIPTDPRSATGACAANGVKNTQFQAPLQAWQTGGDGAGDIPANVLNGFAWPPSAISTAVHQGIDVSLLPMYTATGPIPTLPAPTFSAASTIDPGSGWFNPQDNIGAYVPVSGCSYPDPWGGSSIPAPTGPTCTGAGVKRDDDHIPLPTTAPGVQL